MRIETKDLTYVYSEGSKALSVKALDRVSLTIEEGEFFGIIGQTGSGKTTFVQHLNGLIKVCKDKGTVTVGDYDLSDKKCDFRALRSKIGMVFQYPEYQLFAETVFDDVAFGLKNFAPDLTDEQIEVRVKEALETVGLNYNKVKEKSPFELSGGQKRRVAIAGVIVTKPEVLVLDEPAAGLDPVGKKEFLALLHNLHKSFVKTVILVSHDMNIVSEYCTRCAIFSHGKIVSVGAPKEVFSSYKQIEALGLELPLTAHLTQKLKSVGVEVDSDLTVNGFIEAVTKTLKGGA
ncbi:MAG: energy-coupling factor transporter ATPase [Clostridia bacterium]|nr:energy-coupling factor transporter ATPase [Clostridia bacterium]